jgi:hypothetical protein
MPRPTRLGWTPLRSSCAAEYSGSYTSAISKSPYSRYAPR